MPPLSPLKSKTSKSSKNIAIHSSLKCAHSVIPRPPFVPTCGSIPRRFVRSHSPREKRSFKHPDLAPVNLCKVEAVLTLDSVRSCLEGAIPSSVATCASDGTPNLTFVSQVHYVDESHVALSFQFFNKTHQNVLANPRVAATVIDPETAAQYQLDLRYLRTETNGPVFESMKAKLAGIASHTGMAGIFKLQGSDIYTVLKVTAVPGRPLPVMARKRNLLSAVRSCAGVLNRSGDLDALLDQALAGLESHFEIRHSMILMLDRAGRRLYTVA